MGRSHPRGVGRRRASRSPSSPISPRSWGAARSATTSSTSRRPTSGNMELLLSHGTAEQKDRWLRPLVRGDIRSCFTMTEPEFAGSNPVWMGTTAVKDGDSWVIDGHKWFTTAADGAAFAIVHGGDQPRRAQAAPAGEHDHRADGHAGIRAGAEHLGHGPPRRRSTEPRRGDVPRRCACPLANLLGDGRRRVRARAGAARAPGASTTACAGSASASAPSTSCAAHAAPRELAPARPLGVAPARPELDRREPGGDRRRAPDGAARRLDDRAEGAVRRARARSRSSSSPSPRIAPARARPRHPGARRARASPTTRRSRSGGAHERGARIYDGADEVHKTSVAKRILRRYGAEQ